MNKKRKLPSVSPEDLNLVLLQDDADSWNVKHKLSEVRDLLLAVIRLEVMVDLIVDFIVVVDIDASKYCLNVEISLAFPNPSMFLGRRDHCFSTQDIHDPFTCFACTDVCNCYFESCGCVACTSEKLLNCLLKFFPTKKLFGRVVPKVYILDGQSGCLNVNYEPNGTRGQSFNVKTIASNVGFVGTYGLEPKFQLKSLHK
jgi:hypothetical protein